MKIRKKSVWMPAMVLTAVFPLMVGLGGLAGADEPVPVTVEEAYPGLATGILKSARLTDMEKDVLLQAYQVEIREDFAGKILGEAPPEMRKELEKNLFFLLEQKAMEMLIKQDAVSMGISADQPKEEMLKAYVERLTDGITVNEAEMKAFYETNKAMVGGMPFDQVKESIEPFLLEQKKVAALDARIEGLGKRTDIRVNRDWVKKQAESARDNPVDKARMSGKPTLVEFGAAGCVPCDMMQPILDKLRKKFHDTLNVVFVHVRENQLLGARFGIRSIPVQAFFDRNGKEVFRHVGFYAEEEVLKQLARLGVK
ncbi:MAG: thioredoxin family protein [Deltaproteobacteria bacterium]|nr:thioredoxin family protein [Deltaproteobacteria bacterium]